MGTFTLRADFRELDNDPSPLTQSVTIRANATVIGPNGVIYDDSFSHPVNEGVLQVELPANDIAPGVVYTIRRPTGNPQTFRVAAQNPGTVHLLSSGMATIPPPDDDPGQTYVYSVTANGQTQTGHVELELGAGGVSDYNDLTNVPTSFPPAAHTSALVTDFTEAAQDAVAAMLAQGTGVVLNYNDAGNTLTITSTATGGVTDPEVVRDTIGTALVGVGLVSVVVNDAADTITITTTATQNSTDAQLRDRSTHTGQQDASTVDETADRKWLTAAERTKVGNAPADTTTALAAKAPIATTVTELVDVAVSASTGQLAAGVTSNVVSGGAYTSPALDGAVATPAKRFAIKAPAGGSATITYPNEAGTSSTVTVLASEVLTLRQKSTNGWGAESGNKPLTSLDARYGTGRLFDPRDYGAKLDTVYISDAALASGQATLATAQAFTGADVGKLVNVHGAGAPTALGTLATARTSGTAYTQIPLSAALTAPVFPGPILLISGADSQFVTTTGADVGATTLPCTSFNANANYGVGSTVAMPTMLATTIASVAAGVPTLAAPAGQTVSGALCCYGSNDTAGWESAFASASVKGGEVRHPGGISLVTRTLTVPGAVTLAGAAIDYSSIVASQAANSVGAGNPRRGSVIRAHGTFDPATPLVKVGTVLYPATGWGDSGNTAGSVFSVALDAAGVAQSACQTIGPRARLSFAEFRNGNTYALDLRGQNTKAFACIADNAAAGIASVRIDAHDIKIEGPGEIRPGGYYQLLVTENGGNSKVSGHDLFGRVTSTIVTYTIGITALTASWGGLAIVDNNINNPSTSGSMMLIKVATGFAINGITVTGNRFYNETGSGLPWCILLDLPATGTSVSGLTVVGNNQDAVSTGGRVSGLIARKGSQGIVAASTVVGNTLDGGNTLFGGGFVPTVQHANVWRTTTAINQSSQEGSSTFSGDGATTSFVVTHAIGVAPTSVILTPTTAAAVGGYVSATSATTFTITYATAPATGTNNVKLNWTAKG